MGEKIDGFCSGTVLALPFQLSLIGGEARRPGRGSAGGVGFGSGFVHPPPRSETPWRGGGGRSLGGNLHRKSQNKIAPEGGGGSQIAHYLEIS